jgi:hypothetical protein
MYDPIAAALIMLDAEAPKKGIVLQHEPIDQHHRTYVVPTTEGRKQIVRASLVADSLFDTRLDLFSVAVRQLAPDPQLLIGLLVSARDFRRARLCIMDPQFPALSVVASFVPNEIHEGVGPRLLHALREVAAVADSLEGYLTGVDVE